MKPNQTTPARLYVLMVTGALLIALAVAPTRWADGPTELRIASWNIEWLGTPDRRRGDRRHHAQNPELLARYLAAARPDIIAFQEVRADGSLDDDPDRESPEIAALLTHLAGERGGEWDHVVFPAHSEAQRTGLAWNAERVTPVGPWRQLHAELAGPNWRDKREPWSAGPRPPHGLRFTAGKGRTDFVVIPIHWKSGGERDDIKRRTEEAEELLAALPRIFDDQDVIVIGDSNCRDTDDRPIQLLRKAGYRDLNARNRSTMVYGDYAVDRAFVPVNQPEFRNSAFRVIGLGDESRDRFATELSDHLLIVMTMRVGRDDD